jgi:porin
MRRPPRRIHGNRAARNERDLVRWRIDIGVVLGMAFLSSTAFEQETAAARQFVLDESKTTEAFDITFALTQLYQHNVRGGLSTHKSNGRYAGSYDLGLTADLQTLCGLKDTSMYLLVEGSWPDVGGIDPVSVGSFFGVNADAMNGQWVWLSELWFERRILDESLLVRVGKFDLTGGFQFRDREIAFDGSRYANDETAQFLNGALVNDPTIAFPYMTIGLALLTSPADHWHLGFALAAREDEDARRECVSWGSVGNGLFAMLEGSFIDDHPAYGGLGGEYRAGLWCQTSPSRIVSDGAQAGVYFSVSQPLICSTDDPDCEGGLGLFARGGWTDGEAAELASFWSIGLAWEALLSTYDVLALGLAKGHFVGGSDPDVPRGSETAVELYYKVPLAKWGHISPDVQYVADPGGSGGGHDALILGVRLQMFFE